MKNFWKLVILLAAVGSCLCITGLAMGANTSGLYIDRNGIHIHSGDFQRTSATDIGLITDIKIDVRTLEVRIVRGDNFGYEIFGDDISNVSVSFEDGFLAIEQRMPLNFSISNPAGIRFRQRDHVTVYLPPRAVIDTVNIVSTSSNISIHDLHARNLTIRSTSGRVMANNIETHRLDAISTSGAITMQGKFHNETTVRATSGDVKLTVDGALDDYNWRMAATSGATRLNGQRTTTRAMVTSSIINNINLTATSGRIDLNFSR